MPRTVEAKQRSSEARRLSGLREALGLTARGLADAFGTTPGAISQWEHGDRTIPGPAIKLMDAYERELALSEEPNDTGEVTGWFARNQRNARAAVLWAVIFGADAFEPSPIARQVRKAAMQRFARILGDLKGLSMKLGQMTGYMDLALREDERRSLEEISQNAKAMTASTVAEILLGELGDAPTKLFREWEHRPIAAASIGQVHRGVSHDGEALAIKVQYPSIVEILNSDLRNIDLLDRVLRMVCPMQQAGVWRDEIVARVREELDYGLEAENQREFGRLFRGRSGIFIPEVRGDLSTHKVLTSSWMTGVSLEVFARNATQVQRDRAADLIWSFHHESLYLHKMFVADPHPGNYLFRDDGVCFLDFGRVKKFDHEVVRSFANMSRALLERNIDRFREEFIALGCVPEPNKYDFHYAYRTMLCFLRPYLCDEPFLFDRQFVERMWTLTKKNVNRAHMNIPRSLVFMDQLHLGIAALLARLGGRTRVRGRVLDFLYGPGVARPPPFSENEMASLAI